MDGEGSLGNFPTEAAASEQRLDVYEQEKPFSIPSLPYAHYIRRFDSSATSTRTQPMELMQHLQEVYLSLLDAMIDNLRALAASEAKDEEGQLIVDPSNLRLGQGLSYNLLMTRRHMHIIPRRLATYRLPDAPSKEKVDGTADSASAEPTIIGCNALAYTVSLQINLAVIAWLPLQRLMSAALLHLAFFIDRARCWSRAVRTQNASSRSVVC